MLRKETHQHYDRLIRLVAADDSVLATNEWMPYPVNSLGLSVPNLEVTDIVLSNDYSGLEDDGFYANVFTITLTTDAVAPYTWLTAEGMRM